jgi:sugar lactone lactonase YvrE
MNNSSPHFANRAPRRARLALALALAAPAPAFAAAVVDTVTGGPSQFYPQTPYGYVDGATDTQAKFNTPAGCALDPSGTFLFVADRNNNVVRRLNLPGNTTTTFAPAWTNRISQPVAVAVDGATNVYVLNRGNGNNGTLLKFNAAGALLATNAVNLTNATALALDGLTNLYVTVRSNRILRISPNGTQTVVATLTNAGVSLQGIAILDNGALVVTDAGLHGLWRIDPFTGAWTAFSGFNGAGDFFGPPEVAQFRSPAHLARAGNNTLVVADRGNHRVKLVDAAGNVSLLYGVSSNFWVQGSQSQGIFPGWWDGPVCETDNFGCDESREPWGVTLAPNGDVFTTEAYWHVIRKVTSTGLSGPGSPGVAPQFNQPAGIALDTTGNFLFIADALQNAVLRLKFTDNTTAPFVTTNLNQPVAVAVDAADNLYVLNRAAGTNGYVLKFNKFGNLLATNALNLTNAAALALDGSTNILVAERAGRIKRIPAGGGPVTVWVTLTNAGVQLEGIVVRDDGSVAVSDAGNHAVWLVNPVTLAVSLLTGNNGAGNTIGTAPFAQLDQPHHLAKAGGGILVVADFANDRVALVDGAGTLTELASTNSTVWFGRAGDPVSPGNSRYVSMRQPAGIVVAPNGDVITAEWFHHNVRRILDTGLTGPGGGGGSTNGIVVTPPTISPNFGYYPMGRLITVSSPNPDVFYTTDGSEPTTNSARVAMTGNVGFIAWVNSTNDLTGLRVRAFVQTNASATVGGVPAPTNSVGVPPGLYGEVRAGIGSTVILPVVANLRTNDRVRSYQFKVEIAPNGTAPMISDQFRALDVGSNDFIRVATAADAGGVASISFVSYTNGPARGLQITAIGTNANVNFQRFAVVALLAVPIPGNASEGDTYTVRVLNSSATSDGVASPVDFPPMAPATILVTNVLYTVGDSAGAAWYNAGEFGSRNLDNADVNNAFYAAAGLRLPYPFSDVFDAMDAYPEDEPGFVGGDGEIRFLDWQVILQRSLRQVPYADGTNNWQRAWASGGNRTNNLFTLPMVLGPAPAFTPQAPWNRQALVAALPVGYATPGGTVDVPVFVKTANGATLSGLQFRCVVTPVNGGPALSGAPTFIPAAGLPTPLQQSFRAGETAVGWALGSFSFGSRTSNYLGVIRFTCPAGALAGHLYAVTFANADGAPDLHTPYAFETRRSTVVVGAPAAPVTDLTSDDWKLHFFGSLDAPAADPNADPDLDGVPNWAEYVAGTAPTDPASRLQFQTVERVSGGQTQLVVRWLSAPGKLYEVLAAPNPSGPWSVLTTVSGDGSLIELSAPAPGGSQFYRLRVLP